MSARAGRASALVVLAISSGLGCPRALPAVDEPTEDAGGSTLEALRRTFEEDDIDFDVAKSRCLKTARARVGKGVITSERKAEERCAWLHWRYTLEPLPRGSSCPHGGLALRLGPVADDEGHVREGSAREEQRLCAAHRFLPVVPALEVPVSGRAVQLRRPFRAGLDLNGDGELAEHEVAYSRDLVLDASQEEGAVRERWWLLPCFPQKWGKRSVYRRCRQGASDAVAVRRVTELSAVASVDDAARLRDEVVALLFGADGWPDRLPDSVTSGADDESWSEVPGVDRIERLQVDMEQGLDSVAYLFFPAAPNGELVLYHQGHRGSFYLGHETISRLLREGYAVLAMAMPLRGYNSRPGKSAGYYNHKWLWQLPPREGTPMRYFLEPVALAVDYAMTAHGFERLHAVGISGGGWTVTLYAALDDRVATTLPVAGSLPFFARKPKGPDWGDKEQSSFELYEKVSYLDLYLMGAVGEGRRFLQIANEHDACCFAGPGHASYHQDVAERARELGGSFSLWVDEGQEEHVISKRARDFVVRALQSTTAPRDPWLRPRAASR